MREAYTGGFEPGIRQAGYGPLRVDGVEHVAKIDDEIIAQIRRSRFVVADFTGHRAGVYFEAGFALGLNLPVIWSCRRDEIGKLHFDIRQFDCIDWTEPGDLADRLQKRIEAVIGAGPRKPPLP
jgi:nucleoside 2-deoxyribosyltransferase